MPQLQLMDDVPHDVQRRMHSAATCTAHGDDAVGLSVSGANMQQPDCQSKKRTYGGVFPAKV